MNKKQQTGNIELHIRELVLYGFLPGERHPIGEAVRQELLRQLTEQGLPQTLIRQARVARLNAGSIQAGQGVKPENIGMQVAQAVYSSVAGGQQPAYGNRASGSGRNR